MTGWDSIKFEAALTHYGDWSFIKTAEVYNKKELVVTLDIVGDRDVMSCENSAWSGCQYRESVYGNLNINQARKLALANHKDITVRFYGQDGYEDGKPNAFGKFINIVELANFSQ